MTSAQRKVFEFVKAFIAEKGWPPTRVEIARAMGFASANAAEHHLQALARHGAIRISAGGARRLAINDAYEDRQ